MKNKARYLRRNQTEIERKIWGYLRNRNFLGLKFRRQYPIEPYIVDFVCLEKKLVLEIDGSQHNEKRNIEYDKKRTEYIENKGFKVIRLWNNDIIQNFEGSWEYIANEIRNIE